MAEPDRTPPDIPALLDDIDLAVFGVDARSGEILWANEATARLLGHPDAASVVGTDALAAYADPAERRETLLRLTHHPDLRAHGHLRLEVRRLRADDGRPVDILLNVRPVRDADGRVVRLDCTGENLGDRARTERAFRESEARFRLIFEHSALGLGLCSPEGLLVRANAALARLAGRPLDDDAPVPVPELFTDPGAVARCLRPGEDVRDLACHVPGAGGTPSPVLVQIEWLRDADGRPHTGVIIVQDLSGHKRDEALRSRLDRLEALGVMAAGIAHDFHNILAGIGGHLELLDHGASAPDARAAIRRELDRATRLTRQLMSFASGGTPAGHTRAFRTLVEETVAFCLRGSDIRARLSFPDGCWTVRCPPEAAGDIVRAMALRAREVSPPGSRLEVHTRHEPGGGARAGDGADAPTDEVGPPMVVLTMHDRGPALDEVALEHLFDPWGATRGGGAPAGHGLGLAAAHALARKAGGSLEADAPPEGGTRLTLRLPAEPPAEPPATTRRRTPAGSRVLVMDDEESIRSVLVAMLEARGARAEATAHGTEAIERWCAARQEGRPFDLVILDLTIPGGMGGAATLAQLRAIDPDVRAIVTSGYSDDPAIRDHRAAGFVAALPKPFRFADLDAAIASALAEPAGAGPDASPVPVPE